MNFGTLIQFKECYSMLNFLRCCGAVCTYIARARWESSDFEIGTLFHDMEIGTPITFLECNAMVNETICGGAQWHVARAAA